MDIPYPLSWHHCRANKHWRSLLPLDEYCLQGHGTEAACLDTGRFCRDRLKARMRHAVASDKWPDSSIIFNLRRYQNSEEPQPHILEINTLWKRICIFSSYSMCAISVGAIVYIYTHASKGGAKRCSTMAGIETLISKISGRNWVHGLWVRVHVQIQISHLQCSSTIMRFNQCLPFVSHTALRSGLHLILKCLMLWIPRSNQPNQEIVLLVCHSLNLDYISILDLIFTIK